MTADVLTALLAAAVGWCLARLALVGFSWPCALVATWCALSLVSWILLLAREARRAQGWRQPE